MAFILDLLKGTVYNFVCRNGISVKEMLKIFHSDMALKSYSIKIKLLRFTVCRYTYNGIVHTVASTLKCLLTWKKFVNV